jgi:hypothetical protein
VVTAGEITQLREAGEIRLFGVQRPRYTIESVLEDSHEYRC